MLDLQSNQQWMRMERRIGRATRMVWTSFLALCLLVLMIGVWLGTKADSTRDGLIIALVVDVICAGYALLIAPWQVGRAVRAERGRFPEREEKVKSLLIPLCEKAGISVPEIYIIPIQAMNAFAAGILAKRQYIGVTAGAMDFLTDRELTAVLAHEVSHIRRKDTLYLGWWVALLGVITFVAIATFAMGISLAASSRRDREDSNSSSSEGEGWILAIIAVVAGAIAILIIQIWLKADMRRREVLADEQAVLLTGSAKHLASALERMKMQTEVLQGPSVLSMFFALTPSSVSSWWERLFDTHPNIDWRIKKLRSIARDLGEEVI